MPPKQSLFASRMSQRKGPTTPVASAAESEGGQVESVLGAVIERNLNLPNGSSPSSTPSMDAFFTAKTSHSVSGFPSVEFIETATKAVREVDADADVDSIANENAERVRAMSEEEREAALNQIMSTFSAETIQKFKAVAEMRDRAKREASLASSAVATADSSIAIPSVTENTSKKAVSFSLHDSQPELVPPPPSEQSKMQWTTPISEDELSKSNLSAGTELRFSFSGDVMDMEVDIPHHLGLHHHGDDPGRAGYTIKELVYLSRSAVPSQRAICTKALVAIITRLTKNEYSPQHASIVAEALRAFVVLVHIRAAMDDANFTVIHEGIEGVAAALGIHTETDSSHDAIHAAELYQSTLNGHVSFEMNQRSLETVESKWSGVLSTAQKSRLAFKEGMSTSELSDFVMSDVVASFSETHLFERIAHLLGTKRLANADASLVLRILIAMARHSSQMAAQISATPVLIETIRRQFICIAWPQTNVAAIRSASLAVSLLTCVAKGGRQKCVTGQVMEAARDLVRFLTLKGELSSESGNISSEKECDRATTRLRMESMRFLGILWEYGVGTRLFMEMRNTFVSMAMDMLNDFKKCVSAGKNPDADFWSECLSYWKMVHAAAKLAWTGSTDGVTAEAVSPLAFVAVEYFHLIRNDQINLRESLALMSIHMDIFGKYLDMLVVKSSACATFLEKLDSQQGTRNLPFVQTSRSILSIRKTVEDPAKKPLFIFGIPHAVDNLVSTAVEDTVHSNVIESSALLDYRIARLQGGESLDPYFYSLLSILNSYNDVKLAYSWTQIYARGVNDLRVSLLMKLVDDVKLTKTITAHDEVLIRSILTFIQSCLPTDADVFTKIVETLAFYPGGFNTSIPVALDILSREFNLDSPATEGRQQAFMIGFSDQTLPARPDWMFLPLEYPLMSVKDVTVFLSSTIKFIETVERVSGMDTSKEARSNNNLLKLANLLKVYMLPAIEGADEVFRLGDISERMATLLELYSSGITADSVETLESVYGRSGVSNDSIQFYKTYQELVAQYMATSFGDATFTKFIVIPLGMAYPHDYRTLFWSEVPVKLMASLELDTGDAPFGGAGAYLDVLERDLGVLDLYLGALVGGLAKKDGGFFRDVCMRHVSGYLFEAEVGSSPVETAFRKRIVESVRQLGRELDGLKRFEDEFLGFGCKGEAEFKRRVALWRSMMTQ
ncbi:RNA polymerase II associated protein 1 [Chytriomyces hyalinus]|nr:RNA polymerase II associated protein 1 [Chytriomyces hyalinus]